MRLLILLLLISSTSYSQFNKVPGKKVARPKLVVGIVVDQMRWDFLYRYYDRYSSTGGFKRMLNEGFSCENTFINYIPSYTACGHATVYTGSVPAIHGIAGNEWWEVPERRAMYCVQDDLVTGVGTDQVAGRMSPRNMITTTITDELKLATNFRSKVIGVAFKDRGSILPAGHSADAAYWYEPASGKFITSTWYMDQLPAWVSEFNNRKLPDQYLKKGWNTLYPIKTYTQSSEDIQIHEGKPFGEDQAGFPYATEKFIGKDYGKLTHTPFGNTVTKEMAIAAVNAEKLGRDSITDFLAISFSTPDYIGHTFGPNSIEAEDNYLRLDRDIGDLLNFLDNKVGKGEYLVFLSADHGAAHVPAFLKTHNQSGGVTGGYLKNVDSLLEKKFGSKNLVEAEYNSQIFLDHRKIDSLQLNKEAIIESIINYLLQDPLVFNALDYHDLNRATIPHKYRELATNGFYRSRSGDILYVLKPGYFHGESTGTTHGSPFPYDTHIPLVWYGWNIKPGSTSRETSMTDIAPTIAALLRIQMPNGSIGQVIGEITGENKK